MLSLDFLNLRREIIEKDSFLSFRCSNLLAEQHLPGLLVIGTFSNYHPKTI